VAVPAASNFSLPAGYLRLSTDVCDIKTAIGDGPNPPYAEARKIYVDGKNSRKSDGSIRTLRGEFSTSHVDRIAQSHCGLLIAW
jgi:hypothetical protein